MQGIFASNSGTDLFEMFASNLFAQRFAESCLYLRVRFYMRLLLTRAEICRGCLVHHVALLFEQKIIFIAFVMCVVFDCC